MVSINVKVINKDNRFGGRKVDISFGSSSFKTPHRSATQKDYHAASTLPHKITIGNPVSEFVSAFNTSSFNAFLTGNGSFTRRREKITSQSVDMMRYSPIMSTILTPTDTKLTLDQLMLFNAFQNHGQLDIISIPPFEYKNMEEFEKVITEFSEVAKSRSQEAMPILPISTDLQRFKVEFESLRKLHNTGICNVIGFSYANPFTHIQQVFEIYKHREEDIWFHAFNVPRTPRGRNTIPVAHIHELQNWGLDTFSPETRDLHPKAIAYLIMKSQTTMPDEIECRRFDSPTLGIFKEPEWITRYGHDLNCQCPVCNGKNLSEFKEEFSHELNGDFNPDILRSADRVHELSTGTKEFEVSMKAIESDDLPSYFNKRELTRGRLKSPK